MEKKMTESTAENASTTAESRREKILKHYQDYILTHPEPPTSVYAFCKDIGIEEREFYEEFANFGQISTSFWLDLFQATRERLENTGEYAEFTVREKLLSFYYGYFESLKQHRSYALKTFKMQLFSVNQEIQDLDALKKAFKAWVAQLIAEGKNREEIANRSGLSDRYDSLYWYQFMFLLDFWRKDNSSGFERTDEAIEKAVNLSFDLVEKNALESAFDFGKFIFQNMR